MDYYKRYMGDYQRDTGHLSLAGHGAFTVLLDHYYSTRKALPSSLEELYRLCRAMTKQEQAAVKVVAEEFFPIRDDGFRHNRRADKEIKAWEELSQEASASGKRGAEVRWGKKDSRTMANPIGTPLRNNSQPHSDRNANPNGNSNGGRYGESMALHSHSHIPIPDPEPEPTSESELETRTRASHRSAKPVSAAELLGASRNGEKGGVESEAETLKRTVVAMLQAGSSPDEIVRTMPSRGLTVEQIADIAREQMP